LVSLVAQEQRHSFRRTKHVAKKYLRKRGVAERYSVHVRTIERMIEDGRLPRPIFLGRVRTPLWDVDELEASDRAATIASRPKRDAAAGKAA
jgi:predicted DNA-binding transcriptional regulator AlpA